MTGGLAGTLTRPAAVLHQATAQGGDGDVPVTTPRLPAREDAERELSRPEYHEHDPGLFQRTIDWLWDRVGDLLSTAAGAAPGGWVGLTAVAVVLILLVVALRLRLGKLRAEPTSARSFLFADGPRSAAEHRAAAEAHAAEARWSQALQERMRAIVRSLEERALLDPRPGRTSDEAAFEAGHALPGHAADLRAAAHAFDEVTYADRPADQHTYTHVADLDTTLQRTTPHLESSAPDTAATPRGGSA
ncbi:MULTISPECIES: DUF4129 domain-containing protein [unclassified Streptomyces]|uniref:DUF4129 domain-containing protein n=1 Tax=unclassified Streptomyces TaxID=2593676 RepID=UPI002DD8B76A|nr:MULTISPECIES: DUF4129 domain-containing protein [unclassified Streptomyces]WSA94379.1 DUF4129 domain-containing protein [Streptomyces sp. NBC_01795]WSS12999.1 DUF4129 domain-containing protein [Streptomyces sp. NBC_01186]WSS41783.1 DUF4129 domain-containing protein [Streptomyces sp. NBC_01187]